MMEVIETKLSGLLLLKPRIFKDERGYFLETFNTAAFGESTGIRAPFVQSNESVSRRGVLRGLHLQAPPHAQAKLVRVAAGAVLDVCVDLREGSATFGQHYSARLDAADRFMLYIPEGMAHGFVALEDNTVFSYLCSNYYVPQAERTLLWNDPDLGIDWGVDQPVVSAKDRTGSSFKQRCWEQ
jgi:dTDP-4-dehydrorhamnose 3,5-epimerase